MSAGVNVAFQACRDGLRARSVTLYDVEILEAHHRHKIDAPSGTALKFGDVDRPRPRQGPRSHRRARTQGTGR